MFTPAIVAPAQVGAAVAHRDLAAADSRRFKELGVASDPAGFRVRPCPPFSWLRQVKICG